MLIILGVLVLGRNGHTQSLMGVNLAGPAFSADRLPGRINFDFIYPTRAELEYFSRKGMNVFRLSVLWERLQPTLAGELDPEELARLKNFIADAIKVRAKVILDIHNYGEYRSQRIGGGTVPVKAFTDLWLRLAHLFGQEERVIFGLMNEPKQQDAAAWAAAVQQTIKAVRRAGALNMILVPGIGWDGAYNFVEVNAQTVGVVEDPLRRSVMEVHQYFDRDSSGTSDTCISPESAVGRLTTMTTWLRSTGRQGFLGEFGVSRRPECLVVLQRVVTFLRDNRDVWLGWTYWAAGPIWGEYMFTIEPLNGSDRPQMELLLPFLRPDRANPQ